MINNYFKDSFKSESALTTLLVDYVSSEEDKEKALSIGQKIYANEAIYTPQEIVDTVDFFKKVYPEEYDGTPGKVVDYLIDRLKTNVSGETSVEIDPIVYFLQSMCICVKYRDIKSRM